MHNRGGSRTWSRESSRPRRLQFRDNYAQGRNLCACATTPRHWRKTRPLEPPRSAPKHVHMCPQVKKLSPGESLLLFCFIDFDQTVHNPLGPKRTTSPLSLWLVLCVIQVCVGQWSRCNQQLCFILFVLLYFQSVHLLSKESPRDPFPHAHLSCTHTLLWCEHTL